MEMIDSILKRIRELNEEARWLRVECEREPAHWVLSRLAEVEGALAGCREELAWAETRRAFRKLGVSI